MNTFEKPLLQDDFHIESLTAAEKMKLLEQAESIIEEILKQVDFDVLQGIFDEQLQASGVETGERVLLPADNIDVTTPIRSLGGFNEASGQIVLNSRKLMQEAIEHTESLGRGQKETVVHDFSRLALNTLIHEQTHRMSDYHINEAGDGSVFSTKLGYHYFEFVEDQLLAKHLLFNEGVTERIAARVYKEYLHRTGDTGPYDEDSEHPLYTFGYFGGFNIVLNFSKKLAEETGVDEETAWKAICHTYYSGDGVDQKEMQDLFEKLLSVDVVEILKEVDEADNKQREERRQALLKAEEKIQSISFTDDQRMAAKELMA